MHYEEDHNGNYENQQNIQVEEYDNYNYSGNSQDSGFEPFTMHNIILFPDFENVSCESCSKLFPVIIDEIDEHIEELHDNDHLVYQCDNCQQCFEDLQELIFHYKYEHNNEEN